MSGRDDTQRGPRPFIVRRRPGQYVQAPELLVTFRETHRTVGHLDLPGFGRSRMLEHEGWDRTALRVTAASKRSDTERTVYPLDANGTSAGSSSFGQHVPRSSDGVAGVARRITDADAATIADIDARIDEHNALIRELRKERKSVVDASWRRAKRILVHELTPEDGERSRRVTE